jgi:rSAM-associated Gly-rich repeat protein
MFRNLFAVIATLMISGGVASASTTETKSLSLEQRIQAAQTTINKLMDVDSEKATKSGSKKLAQYWSNYYRPWHNWNNWSNWRNYRGGYGY